MKDKRVCGFHHILFYGNSADLFTNFYILYIHKSHLFDKMAKKFKGGIFLRHGKTFFTKEGLMDILKPTKKKIIIVSAVLVVAIATALIFGGKKSTMNTVQAEDTVTRGDITVTITGSAAVEPYERFEIIPKVSGDIVYCPYEVGDSISKDDVLYMFDTSDTDLSVERQRISMQQSQNSYNNALEEGEKLYIKAKNSGVISGLSVNEGQEVTAGFKIATVEDTKNLEVEVPFTGSQIDSVYIGDVAQVTSSKHMSTVSGTVTHKSSSSYVGTDGTALYSVVIEFENPGAFYAGMEVGASVNGNISPGKGTISYRYSGTSSTETDGTVVKVHYENGDYVNKGDVIVTLESDTIQDRISDSTLSYKSAGIAMQQTEKSLEDYNIKSPINGTVITKNAKAGDTIDKTNSASTLMVVADISKLKFELAIDELDVSKVAEGQKVSVTCDALPEEEFEGVITNVSVEGTAANGVTTYAAQVEIAEPGNLRPSMNIDAEIIIESAYDVLMVPTEDIKTVGGRSYVFKKDDGTVKKAEKTQEPEKDELPVLTGEEDEKLPKGERPDGNKAKGEIPQRADGEEKAQQGSNGQKKGAGNMTPQAPDGYVAVEIKTGISNEDYTQVISGLSEGDIVYKTTTASSTGNSMMPGGRMQGGMGGGMPSGGMGGGMPSGGMGGMPGGGMR